MPSNYFKRLLSCLQIFTGHWDVLKGEHSAKFQDQGHFSVFVNMFEWLIGYMMNLLMMFFSYDD